MAIAENALLIKKSMFYYFVCAQMSLVFAYKMAVK